MRYGHEMKRFGKNVLITGGTILVSRVLGFGRDAAMAWILGTGPVADALSVALRLPWAARRLLGEGSLSMGLSVACTAQPNPCGLALAVGKRLFLPAVLVLAMLLLFAPVVVDVLAPGVSASLRREAAFLLRLTLPYVLFAGGAACCMAGMHATNRFALAGMMPSLFNVLMLGFAGVAVLAGTGAFSAACLLSAGVFFGGLVQWLILLRAAQRERDRCAPCPSAKLQVSVARMASGILGAAVPQLCFVLAGVFASWQGDFGALERDISGQGDMAALFYAERLLEFPLGVLGAAVGMALVPELRNTANTTAVTARVLEWTLALHVAAGAGLAAVSEPLVALLYGHGAFTAEAVARTALCLQVYALCLPAYAASRPLLAACAVHGLSGVVNAAALAGLLACGLSWGGIYGLMGSPVRGLLGSFIYVLGPATPALCVVIGLSVQALWLWVVLFRRTGLRVPVLRVALNIPAGLAVYSVATSAVENHPGAIGLGLGILYGVAVWAVLCGCVLLFGRIMRSR